MPESPSRSGDVDLTVPCATCGAEWKDEGNPFAGGPRQMSRLHEPGCEEVAVLVG
jgi:hypothetical protein